MKPEVVHTLDEIKSLLTEVESHVFELLRELNNGDIIRYKSDLDHNVKREFEQCDNRLRFIFLSYCAYIYRKYGYKPQITCVERTQKEQDNIYGGDVEYIQKPWQSVHQSGRGIDFSDYDMPIDILKDTEEYFNEKQIVYTGEKNTCLKHNVGHGSHFHAQVDPDEYTSIKKI